MASIFISNLSSLKFIKIQKKNKSFLKIPIVCRIFHWKNSKWNCCSFVFGVDIPICLTFSFDRFHVECRKPVLPKGGESYVQEFHCLILLYLSIWLPILDKLRANSADLYICVVKYILWFCLWRESDERDRWKGQRKRDMGKNERKGKRKKIKKEQKSIMIDSLKILTINWGSSNVVLNLFNSHYSIIPFMCN